MLKKIGVLLAALALAATPVLATEQKKVSIYIAYTGIDDILKQFTEDTGIEAEYLDMSSGEVLTRLRAAKGKAQADVWLGGGLDSYVAAANEGFLEPYVSPERSAYDPIYYNHEGYWSGFSINGVDIAVNTEFAEKKRIPIPSGWEDLTRPIYKGEVLMAAPSVSGTFYAMIWSILSTKGEDAGWKLLEAMDKNVPYYCKRGPDPANKMCAGEVAVAIGPFDAIEKLKDAGYKIVTVFPADGVPWLLSPVALFRGAKNPEAGKALIDWILSEKGQKAVAQYSVQAPVLPGIKMQPAVQAMRDSNLARMDVVRGGQERARVLSEWQKRFGSK